MASMASAAASLSTDGLRSKVTAFSRSVKWCQGSSFARLEPHLLRHRLKASKKGLYSLLVMSGHQLPKASLNSARFLNGQAVRAPGGSFGSSFVPPISQRNPSMTLSNKLGIAKSRSNVAAHASTSSPDAEGWIRYQGDANKGSQAGILPMAIGFATALYAYPKILPYMLMLLDHIRQAHWAPHYLGIPGLDAFLGILVPFFADVFASADYGRIVVAYFSAIILSWALAAGVESSRMDARQSKLVHNFAPFVSFEVVSGVGILTPLIWITPFLRMRGNTDSAAQLTPATVAGKLVSAQRVRLLSIVILASFVPYVAGYFVTGTKYQVNQALVILPPLFWQLLWSPTTTTDADSPFAGHLAAQNLHRLAAGVGLLQHVLCVSQLVERPGMLPRLLGLFHNHPLHLRPTLFVLVTTISLWAALLTIPLAQEGSKKALDILVKSLVLGPAAAVSLYFAARETAYLEVALSSKGPL